jgi:Domain of unknown function (DUF4129)
VVSGDPVGGAAARRAARALLRRAEYHRDDPGPITRALHWMSRHLAKLFDGAGAGGSHAILLIVLALVAVAVVFAVRAGAVRRVARAAPAPDLDLLAATTASDHRRRAERLTAEGRHAEALREWLRAAVATITERGVLPPRPGRTGSATAREAAPLLPAAAPELSAAMQAFDEVWFGARAAHDGDVRVARAAADAVATARIHLPDVAASAGVAVPR